MQCNFPNNTQYAILNPSPLFPFRELLPMIDSLRDNLAHRVAAKWKDLFKLTLSFADGSSARVSAINAALKPYRFVLNLLYHS